ncbi:hypothetical protein [Telluribacter humicola]|uniref:hypothetical protein n=1 Tax=Telluribacter humicola TaxID=1720261 RepID=UPI001A966D5B|nr:hypothetical protein [Telluribacter humicola]
MKLSLLFIHGDGQRSSFKLLLFNGHWSLNIGGTSEEPPCRTAEAAAAPPARSLHNWSLTLPSSAKSHD